jgi:SAM-dependent methyltransferase
MAQVPTLVAAWPTDGIEHVERCPACGHASRRPLYADLTDRTYRSAGGRWSLFCCADCSCAYLDPRPDERTASLAYRNYYEGVPEPTAEVPAGGWRRLRRALRNGYLNSRYGYDLRPAAALGRLLVPLLPRHRELADELVRHLPLAVGRPRLLDVGCGEGAFLARMQSLGWSVEGIEPSSEAAARARERGVAVQRETLAQGSLEPGSFDAITFRLVFEHLRDPVSALAECRRTLRPGGVVWIATPSLEAAAHRVFRRDWIHLEAPRHAVLYTPSALGRLLSRTGFEVGALHPLRQARWSFRMSAALASGLSPFEDAPPLSRKLALRAALADLEAARHPEAADVIVVIAYAR